MPFLLVLIFAALAEARSYGCRSSSNHGSCYNYRFTPGSTNSSEMQKLFIARSGLIGNTFPYAAVAGARCSGDCPRFGSLSSIEDYNPTNGFTAAGAGFIWAYRGVGVVCDRDGTDGYQDPNPRVVGNTNCREGNNPSASTDCIAVAAGAESATWDSVETNLTYRPNVASVEISEASGLYKQECYLRFGGASAPQSPSDSSVNLGDYNAKCDISFRDINKVRRYGSVDLTIWSAVNAIITSNNIQNCPVANRFFAVQLWFLGRAISNTVVTGASTDELSIDPATRVRWTRTVECEYSGGAKLNGEARPNVRVFTSSADLPTGSPTVSTVGRVNFQFSCPAMSNGQMLDRINWDPEFSLTEADIPLSDGNSAAGMSVNALLLAIAMAFLLLA